MTFTNPTDQAPTSNRAFSAETFRAGMGPGYQSATFTEQSALTQPAPKNAATLPPSVPRLAVKPWVPVVIAVASTLIGRALRRFRPSRQLERQHLLAASCLPKSCLPKVC